VDTTQFADGPLTLTAHAWNAPAGASFTSEADAGAVTLTVQNGAAAPPSPEAPPPSSGATTVGGGTKEDPARGPAPSFAVGGGEFTLVKNWDFGESGTIRSGADMDAHFAYHDQFNTIGNGSNYGAIMLASSASTALAGQPVEDPARPVRQFLPDSLKTLLVPLRGATTVSPNEHNVGSGSFMAKFTLPKAGAALGQDILWETRVRFVPPPYYWFAIWVSGQQWQKGAEFDVVESFGFDNGGGSTNYDGTYWHSNSVADTDHDRVDYANWPSAMSKLGFGTFDPTTYHTWTMLYRKDDTFSFYCDGKEVQHGQGYPWTLGAKAGALPLDMVFLFDGGWGHTTVSSVNHSLPASALDGKYYEWDYSRLYLR